MKTFICLICSLWLSFAVQAAELKFEPATPSVEVDKEIELSVIGTVGRVEWSPIKGYISNSGTKVTYRAPSDKPAAGFDVVTVSDAAGNIAMVKVTITKTTENAVWEVFANRREIEALLLSEDGRTLWVGTTGGLEKRKATTGEIQRVFTNLDGLPDNRIEELLSDNQGGLWIVTNDHNGGKDNLAHYTADGQWQVFNTKNSGLTTVRSIGDPLLSDNQDGLWIVTNDPNGGKDNLAYCIADGQCQVFNTKNSGLPDKYVAALLSDDKGGLWIGTEWGGLVHYTADGQWQVFNAENSGLPSNYVSSLFSDNQGGLWIKTYDSIYDKEGKVSNEKTSLVRYTADGQWQVFNVAENIGLPSNSKYGSLHSDNQGGLWFTIFTDDDDKISLVHYTAAGQWQVFDKDNSWLPSNYDGASFLSDNQGGQWIWIYDFGKGYHNLAHYTADGQWQVLNTIENFEELPSNDIEALLSDNQGGLWIGTSTTYSDSEGRGGLAHYTANGQWHRAGSYEREEV